MENFKGGVEIKVLLFSVHHNGLFCVAQGLAVSTDHWPYISNTLGTQAWKGGIFKIMTAKHL